MREPIWTEPTPALKPLAQRQTERRIAAVRALYTELAEVLEVCICRGDSLGYVDDDYRKRLKEVRTRLANDRSRTQ